jgi:hypothetical protein
MDAPPLDELGTRLGIVPRDPELIRQAFVHSSYFNENPSAVAGHNERLEFYGDARPRPVARPDRPCWPPASRLWPVRCR